jgi:hypothetical protein
MTRIYATALLALSALVSPTSDLIAQTSDQGRVQGGRAETCHARAGGSRIRSNNCETEAPRTVRAEHEVTVRVELPGPRGPQCEATALTEYSQRGPTARVTGTVSIDVCPAGTTGTFTLVARVRDATGEITSIEFDETWQRDDAEDVKFAGDYPIGANVELVSARVRGLTCTCAASPASAPDTPALEAAAPAPPR